MTMSSTAGVDTVIGCPMMYVESPDASMRRSLHASCNPGVNPA
jgi:hypothetical protein